MPCSIIMGAPEGLDLCLVVEGHHQHAHEPVQHQDCAGNQAGVRETLGQGEDSSRSGQPRPPHQEELGQARVDAADLGAAGESQAPLGYCQAQQHWHYAPQDMKAKYRWIFVMGQGAD